ncbi:lactonase family protein [bacterium]|nr:lactonase family protein [bacterium]
MLLSLAALQFTGCVPAAAPVWVADSQSFLYTKADGSVVQYNLNNGSSRQLVATSPYMPANVAISPNQEVVATAIAEWHEGSRAVGLHFHNLQTGEELAFRNQIWGTGESSLRKPTPSSVYCSPDGKRLLICYLAPTGYWGNFAVYEVNADKLTELKTTSPSVLLTSLINCSPFLPDSSGFLAVSLRENGMHFSVVDWDGWETAIELSDDLKRAIPIGGDKEAREIKFEAIYPLPKGKWNGNVLEFRLQSRLVQLDTKKKTASLVSLPDAMKVDLERVAEKGAENLTWKSYQVEKFAEGPYEIWCRFNPNTDHARIEQVDTRDERRRSLIEGKLQGSPPSRPLTPAPDGKHILVSLLQENAEVIHVIRHDGKIVATLPVGERGFGPKNQKQ